MVNKKKEKWMQKGLKKKTKFKRILPKKKVSLEIKKFEPAPYVSRYFEDEWEEAKQSMFFK